MALPLTLQNQEITPDLHQAQAIRQLSYVLISDPPKFVLSFALEAAS
jgi:hypothetical protein